MIIVPALAPRRGRAGRGDTSHAGRGPLRLACSIFVLVGRVAPFVKASRSWQTRPDQESHQLAGPFPAGKSTEERLYLRLARNPTTKGKRDQAHGTNLLDDFAEALIEVRSRATPISL